MNRRQKILIDAAALYQRDDPHLLLIGTDQCFRRAAEIQQLFEQQQIQVQNMILYCGGGILACVLALGIRLYCDDDFSIYDGSLQQWAWHTALPLLTKE